VRWGSAKVDLRRDPLGVEGEPVQVPAGLASSHPLAVLGPEPQELKRSSNHSSPWHPPSLGCWHGNRPPGTPRAGTTVSGGQLVGGRGKVGTRQMGATAGGWGLACLFLPPKIIHR
jgi:hypothetical protein